MIQQAKGLSESLSRVRNFSLSCDTCFLMQLGFKYCVSFVSQNRKSFFHCCYWDITLPSHSVYFLFEFETLKNTNRSWLFKKTRSTLSDVWKILLIRKMCQSVCKPVVSFGLSVKYRHFGPFLPCSLRGFWNYRSFYFMSCSPECWMVCDR